MIRKRIRVILILLGILSILYCLSIAVLGHGTRFFLIWGVIGAAFILLGWILGSEKVMQAIPKPVKYIAVGVGCIGLVLFLFIEGLILGSFRQTPSADADYCIVLGAQWRNNGPSEVLKRRLDRAAEYLKENPDCVAIVSGGQGSNEVIAEADGMKQYLIQVGIEGERILTESKSRNTLENIRFSKALLPDDDKRIIIVTNNFHVFRAVQIARTQGLNAQGCPAGSMPWMFPQNMLRECFGVIKDFAVGNLQFGY